MILPLEMVVCSVPDSLGLCFAVCKGYLRYGCECSCYRQWTKRKKKMAGENVCVLGLSPDPDGQPLIAQHKNLGTVTFM